MMILKFIFLSFLALSAEYSELKYKTVTALTTDDSGGVTIPNGETVAVIRFIGSGVDPDVYTRLVWCYDTVNEKVFGSTTREANILFNRFLSTFQITGDGSCKLQIIIDNNSNVTSPTVGGFFEAVTVN